VVSAEDEEVFGVFDFVCEEETYYFNGLFASIDVVTEEKVIGLRQGWWVSHS
jgi:hypothetical protein